MYSTCYTICIMSPQDIIKYWQDTAAEDWATAESLFETNHFSNALFFCHLSIEKLLKGLVYVKTNEPPLRIHNIEKLAQETRLSVPTEYHLYFDEITSWNMEARYDSIKREFYTKATKQYSQRWMKIAKEIFLWLKKQY